MGLKIAIIIVFTIFMAFALLLGISLLLTYINRFNEVKIKKQLNSFLNFEYDQKMERLLIISDYRTKYNAVIDTSLWFKNQIAEHMKIYRKEISDISILNLNFNVIIAFFRIKKIKKEFREIQFQINKFNKTIDIIYNYCDIRDEPYEKLVDYTREVTVLYEMYISNHYSNPKITNIFFDLSKELKDLNMGRVENEVPELNDAYWDILNKLIELSYYIYNMYTYNQVAFYIKSNIKEISNSLFSGNYSLGNLDSRMIEKKLNFLKENSLKIEGYINELKFDECEQIVKECSKTIREIKEKMNYSIKYDDYLIKKVIPILTTLKNNSEHLAKFSAGIKDNFKENEQIHVLSIKFYNLLRKNVQNCKQLLSKDFKFADDKKIEFVTACKKDLEYFEDISDSLLEKLDEYYKLYSRTLRDIFTYKKTIAKMLNKIKINSKDINENLVLEFKDKLLKLDHMEESLASNIGLLLNDNFNEDLINIKAWIVNTHLAYMKDMSYKNIAKDLIVYSYRYMGIDDKFDSLVTKSELLYNSNEYKKVIDSLLPKIKIMKKKIKIINGENIPCQENI